MEKKTVKVRSDCEIPAKCPITGRTYFCAISHPNEGEMATYGGPFDSYSIPRAYPCDEFPEAKEFRCRHFDHDDGAWSDGTESIDLFMVERETMLELYDLRDNAQSQAATIARLTAEKEAAVRERDELREAVEKIRSHANELRYNINRNTGKMDAFHEVGVIQGWAERVLAARPSSEEGGG